MQIPWLFPILIFSLTFNKIPWLFSDFCQVWNFPDFSLTAGHPVVRYTVSEPFDTKLSIWNGGDACSNILQYFNARPRYTVKLVWGRKNCVYHILKGFTAIYIWFCFKWYIIQYGKIHGLRAFWYKTFHMIWGWRLFGDTAVFNGKPGMQGKSRLGKVKMAVIVNQITLLQSTGNSVSNDTLFVMLRCLISKPFNTKLSIRY